MILLIDKPKGITSFDLIRKLQRIYPKTKIGHAGTLDPMATGLMIVAIGKDTKRLGEFLGARKTYRATIDLSLFTDSWDNDPYSWIFRPTISSQGYTMDKETIELAAKWGRERKENNIVEIPTIETISTLLASMIDMDSFPLTPFSAKKIQGKKLYEFARAGSPIHKMSPMEIISINCISYEFPLLSIDCNVGSGTYIRSLGYRIGNSLGWGGSLIELRRTTINSYQLPQ